MCPEAGTLARTYLCFPSRVPCPPTIRLCRTTIRTYTVVFPSWKDYADGIYKLYDAEICYIAHRQFSMLGEDLWPAFFTMFVDPTKSLDNLEEFVNDPKVKDLTDEVRHYCFPDCARGNDRAVDLEYQEKVLDKILADTGGHRVRGHV